MVPGYDSLQFQVLPLSQHLKFRGAALLRKNYRGIFRTLTNMYDRAFCTKNYFRKIVPSYVMLCAIWSHICNLKKVKNTYGGVLLLVKLQGEACNSPKSNTPPWVFFTFFKLYKWYQIAQSVSYIFHGALNRPLNEVFQYNKIILKCLQKLP